HQQHAVKAVEEKRAAPIPPAALKSPEISKRSAAPAVKTSLHGHDAVQFRRRERNRDAPEKRHEREKQHGHARAGAFENLLVAKRPAARVAVENSKQRKKTDLANRASGDARGIFLGVSSAGHFFARDLDCGGATAPLAADAEGLSLSLSVAIVKGGRPAS